MNIGPLTFNSSVSIGGSTCITGDVNSGSSLNGGTSLSINGNVVSGDIVQLGGSTNLTGNLDAQGNVNLGTSLKVYGNLTTAGNLYKSNSTIIYGTITENGTPFVPKIYTPITLPAATVFVSGGSNVTNTCTLVPGSYGNITLGTSKTLNLSSGDYYFNSFTMGGSGKLNLNVSNGKIRIFVTGNVSFGTSLQSTVLNGDFKDVYLETQGNFSIGGSGKWNGIIFCPLGKITTGTSCLVKGALWSNGDISIGGSTKVYGIDNSLNKQQEILKIERN